LSESSEPSKRCRDCGEIKALTAFWRNKKSPDGHALYCIPCFRLRNSEAADRRAAKLGRARRPHRTPEQPVPEGQKYYPGCTGVLPLDAFVRNRSAASGIGTYCRPCQNAKATASRNRIHGSSRHYHLRRRYGIGAAEVAAMLARQSGCCAVCLRPLSVKNCHVDHDHVTGRVRGILCFNCNGGLGQFRDDIRLLRRAARYLRGQLRAGHGRGSWGHIVLDDPTPSRMEEALRERLAELGVGPAS
jgi:5-methylcytosine-specific restriction endonuclease McrA